MNVALQHAIFQEPELTEAHLLVHMPLQEDAAQIALTLGYHFVFPACADRDRPPNEREGIDPALLAVLESARPMIGFIAQKYPLLTVPQSEGAVKELRAAGIYVPTYEQDAFVRAWSAQRAVMAIRTIFLWLHDAKHIDLAAFIYLEAISSVPLPEIECYLLNDLLARKPQQDEETPSVED